MTSAQQHGASSDAGQGLRDDRRCFACGPENERGLRMQFAYGDGTARAHVTLAREFGGWTSIAHGGIAATLLDEAMAHAAVAAGVRAVTARIEVRFRKPVPIETPLVAEGIVKNRRGRVLEIEGTLSGVDGTLYAQSHARFVAE